MKTEWLFAWYNLIFVVPFLLALVYVGVYAVSGITFGEGGLHGPEADMDADADAHLEADGHVEADAHVDVDADADADAHLEHDAHLETDADADADDGHSPVASGSALATMLSVLGVGKVPLSIVLTVLLFSWGMIGFVSNFSLWDRLHSELAVVGISIVVAAIGSTMLTRLVSSAMSLGSVGEAILPIDEKFGMAAVRDSYNDLFHVPCRVNAQQATLEKGTKIKLVGYNGKQKIYYVAQYDPAVAGNRTA